ncbi:MAG TPA: hypothetical protein VFT49_01780 [Candidatus Saccharimonadales bacterium]|nr:hypothetical protein [Candidatus Saccharimonadales bacterium]
MSAVDETLQSKENQRPEYFQIGETPVIVQVPMDSYIIAGQMRAAHDSEKHQELVHDIKSHNEMHTSIFLAQTPLDVARRYVSYTNECWGKNVQVPENKIQPDGTVLILAAGHRRDRAYLQIAKENGYSREQTLIHARVFPCLSPEEIMRLQISENFHDRPPAIQYAKAVREMYFVGCKEGRYNSIADFLPDSPLGQDATREALRYFALPEVVHKLVDDGRLSYNLATELTKLHRAAIDYFIAQRSAEAEGGEVSAENYLDLLELATLDADDRVKSAAINIASKMNPALPKSEKMSSDQARKRILGQADNLRNTNQLEIYTQTQNAIERQVERWHQSAKKRQTTIARGAVEGLLLSKSLVEVGAHLPIEGRDLERIRRVAQRATELGLLDAIDSLGRREIDETLEVHPDQLALG